MCIRDSINDDEYLEATPKNLRIRKIPKPKSPFG